MQLQVFQKLSNYTKFISAHKADRHNEFARISTLSLEFVMVIRVN